MSIIKSDFSSFVRTLPEFNTMLHAMAKEVDSFMHTFNDEPSNLSGWGHIYFCNDDGGRLVFDPKKPHHHVCQVCGRSIRDTIRWCCGSIFIVILQFSPL